MSNHLSHEHSPYLLQHAHNPVDWYPWGQEAFQRAREQGRPIFLSVGYSTCHWCHVMERESFENGETARTLNEHFVSIKVPIGLARLAARFTPFYYRAAERTPRFTPYSLEVLRSNSHISHAKATRELGYQPRNLYESITDAVHWFLEKKGILRAAA